jgi:hypothetical protein
MRNETPKRFDRLKETKVRMVSAVGQGRDITYGEMLAMAWQSTTFYYLVIVTVALTVFDVNGYQDRIGILGSAIAWGAGVAVVTLSFNLVLFFWTLANLRFGRRIILMPGVSFLSTFTTLTAVEAIVALMSGDALDWDRWLRLFPYIFLVIEVFDVIYIAFAMPVIRAATANKALAEAPKPPAEVDLSGQRLRADRMLWATSQDHYLRIVCEDEKHLILARMADLVRQTGPGRGIQPHRSWWVSSRAGAVLAKAAKGDVLKLADGTEVPVARSRLAEVRVWLDSLDGDGAPG